MNWKIGQKLVYIGMETSPSAYGPKQNDIVTFDGLDEDGWTLLVEYAGINPSIPSERTAYRTSTFRPLLGQSATAELVSSFIEITETSDLPIRSPQPTEPCGS